MLLSDILKFTLFVYFRCNTWDGLSLGTDQYYIWHQISGVLPDKGEETVGPNHILYNLPLLTAIIWVLSHNY